VTPVLPAILVLATKLFPFDHIYKPCYPTAGASMDKCVKTRCAVNSGTSP
jgi:hypothetical protein